MDILDLIEWFIFILWSFSEAIFFPLPVDLAIIMLVTEGKDPYLVAFLATFFNTLGSILGYKLGSWLNNKKALNKAKNSSLIRFIIDIKATKKLLKNFKNIKEFILRYHKKEDVVSFLYLLSTITPLPQKIFAIISGYFKINFLLFIIMTVIGRGSRFFAVALLTNVLSWKISLSLVILISLIYFVIHTIFNKKIKK